MVGGARSTRLPQGPAGCLPGHGARPCQAKAGLQELLKASGCRGRALGFSKSRDRDSTSNPAVQGTAVPARCAQLWAELLLCVLSIW